MNEPSPNNSDNPVTPVTPSVEIDVSGNMLGDSIPTHPVKPIIEESSLYYAPQEPIFGEGIFGAAQNPIHPTAFVPFISPNGELIGAEARLGADGSPSLYRSIFDMGVVGLNHDLGMFYEIPRSSHIDGHTTTPNKQPLACAIKYIMPHTRPTNTRTDSIG